jgi:hypothetical protein
MRLNREDLLIVTGLLALLAGVLVSAPHWTHRLRQPLPDDEDAQPTPVPAAQPPAGATAEKKISVKLYFESSRESALVPEEREIPFSSDLSQQLRTVVEELIRGSSAGHLAPFPPETKVLGVIETPRGIAYVDLSKEAASGHGGGSSGERLSVYAIVNSVVGNFPAVKRVQILIEDRPVATLAGHVDLSRPLLPDMTLVAAAIAPAAAAAPAEPGTASPPPSSPLPSPTPGGVTPP